jgi:hypothetical protein
MDVYFFTRFYLFKVVFVRHDRRMVVYGYKPDTFIAVIQPCREETPHVETSSKMLRSI